LRKIWDSRGNLANGRGSWVHQNQLLILCIKKRTLIAWYDLLNECIASALKWRLKDVNILLSRDYLSKMIILVSDQPTIASLQTQVFTRKGTIRSELVNARCKARGALIKASAPQPVVEKSYLGYEKLFKQSASKMSYDIMALGYSYIALNPRSALKRKYHILFQSPGRYAQNRS
jgi:hypothetical protein